MINYQKYIILEANLTNSLNLNEYMYFNDSYY